MGRKQGRDNVRNGGVSKTVAIGEHISVSKVLQDTKESSTKILYSRQVMGNRGWVEWTAAQGVASSGLGESAAVTVCDYYYFRTNCFALGLSVGNQIVAALAGHYEATTRCGGGAWNVLSSEGGAISTSGNPARSTNIHKIKAAHQRQGPALVTRKLTPSTSCSPFISAPSMPCNLMVGSWRLLTRPRSCCTRL